MSNLLVRQLAWRYMLGKRSANAVPILSRISMIAIGVGAAAMIVLFSVFNGFEGLVKDLYKAFYPEIKIAPASGKFFRLDDTQFDQLKKLDGISAISRVIEDNVFIISNADEKKVATIKGIDANYLAVNDVAKYVTEGKSTVATEPVQTALAGSQLLAQLGMDVNNVFSSLQVYYPNPKVSPAEVAQSPDRAFNILRLRPDGAFTIQEEFDNKYLLADISLVQTLMQEEENYSSLELKLATNADPDEVRGRIEQLLGSGVVVQTRFEQNKSLYTVMQSEKWAVYVILVLVLVVAAFNMVGALSLLVLEKQKDISILKAMGARDAEVSRIFLAEGALWSLLGGGTGLLLGTLICLGQQQFGWLKLGGAFIIDAYPVRLQPVDFLVVILTILAIGLLAAWFPASRAARIRSVSLRTD